MPITVTMLQTRRGEDGSLWLSGQSYEATNAFAELLITANLATGLLPGVPSSNLDARQVAALQALVSGERIADAASRAITTADNGKFLAPTQALTYTIPDGLSPMPSFTVDCPVAGTITIARSGGATLNGAGTSLTRTRSSNPVGFVVLAHESDAYGVSGA